MHNSVLACLLIGFLVIGCAVPRVSHHYSPESNVTLPAGTVLYLGDVQHRTATLALAAREQLEPLLRECENWKLSSAVSNSSATTQGSASSYRINAQLLDALPEGASPGPDEKISIRFTLTNLATNTQALEQITSVINKEYVAENGNMTIGNSLENLVEKGIKKGAKQLRERCGCKN